MATVGKRVLYSGRVQGVGFRATARDVASGFPVSGHVRNLPGGDVELVAEGEPDAVDAFLDSLARRLTGFIDRVTVRDEPAAGLRGFVVRR
jgi:acylphosphatase